MVDVGVIAEVGKDDLGLNADRAEFSGRGPDEVEEGVPAPGRGGSGDGRGEGQG